VYLGTFDTAEDAANAHDKEAVRLHGVEAVTNFKQPPMVMDLDGGELPALDFSPIPGAQLDDVWTDLPQAEEVQPLDELLHDMDFTQEAAYNRCRGRYSVLCFVSLTLKEGLHSC
jgi:hypothetical protein